MEIENFLKIIRECKSSAIHTGYSERIGDLKVIVNSERTIFTISKKPVEKVCKCCGTDLTKYEYNNLKIKFYEPEETMSIFQAYLLWMMFKMKIKPIDYANYHKCIAGERFIKNIEEVC